MTASPLCAVSQVRNEFYKDSQGVLLVYDVGLRESFDALDSWLGEMKQEMGSQANMDSIVFVVCANKVTQNQRGKTKTRDANYRVVSSYRFIEKTNFPLNQYLLYLE